jgi:pimeloyl-ACP methyl ester carboxylesterase
MNNRTSGKYWQWQGHSIYYVEARKAQDHKPPLLLVHGFGASTDHWDKNINQLQADYQVYAIDLLGFGRSAKPKLEYSGKLWQDQLNDFITEVIKKPVVLAGNSLGGYASLCVASQHPESAAGLVLVNSAGPFSDVTSEEPNLLQKVSGWILRQPLATYILFQYLRNPSTIRKTLQKVYLDQSAVTEKLVQDIYRPSCDKGAPQVFASVFKNPQGEKVDHLLQKLQCPLLMIWGEGDPWMRVKERSAKFKQHYPNLTEFYLNAGHCPHDEVPEQFNRILHHWVTEKLSLDLVGKL